MFQSTKDCLGDNEALKSAQEFTEAEAHEKANTWEAWSIWKTGEMSELLESSTEMKGDQTCEGAQQVKTPLLTLTACGRSWNPLLSREATLQVGLHSRKHVRAHRK